MDESSGSQDAPALRFKVAVLGDGAVGKSALCNRFCRDFYAAEYRQTLGLDFYTQSVTLADGREVAFDLFDIGGHSVTSRMLPTYCRGADCALYVYDLTSAASLAALPGWRRAAGLEGCVSVLVGNKSDLASRRAVRAEDEERAARELGAALQFSVSALTGDRVGMLFLAVAGRLTGADVRALMLERRKVVAAQVRAEDERTAAAANRAGAAAPAAAPERYERAGPAAGRVERVERARRRRGCGAM